MRNNLAEDIKRMEVQGKRLLPLPAGKRQRDEMTEQRKNPKDIEGAKV